MPDRVPVAAEPAQRLDEVLGAVDRDCLMGLEGRAQGVGPDVLLQHAGALAEVQRVEAGPGPGVVEPAPDDAALAVAQDWEGDVRIVLFVRLQSGHALDEALTQKIRATIRSRTPPRHVPAKIIAVPDLPRTLSGKLTELAVRNIIHGRPVQNRDALANPAALEYFRDIAELRS